jgi:Zn ribbon nucleic-acid-binding protein
MTHWFISSAGSPFHASVDDESMVLVSSGPPDWVKIPEGAGPPHGGSRVRVSGHFYAPCPMCRTESDRLHMTLEGVEVMVCECTAGCGFVFYTLPETASEHEEVSGAG